MYGTAGAARALPGRGPVARAGGRGVHNRPAVHGYGHCSPPAALMRHAPGMRTARYLLALVWLLAVTASPAAADPWTGAADRWPVAGASGAGRPVVVRGWDPPAARWGAGHRGVDLRAPAGTRVRAVADGRVSFAGPVGGRGVVTVTLEGTGDPPLRVTYQPVEPAVHQGEEVRAGDVVGSVAPGRSHCSPGCLHWGLLRGAQYLNPLSALPARLLRGGPSRLLPVFGVPLPDTHRDLPRPAAAGPGRGPAGAVLLAAAAVWAHGRLRRTSPRTPYGRRRRAGRVRRRCG